MYIKITGEGEKMRSWIPSVFNETKRCHRTTVGQSHGRFFVFLLLRCVLLTVRRAVIYFIRLFLNLWAFEQSTTMEINARNMSSYN